MTEPKPTYRTEHDIQAELIELLLLNHALVIRVNSGRSSYGVAFNRWQVRGMDSQTAGVSDLIAIMPDKGDVWFIECKSSRGRVRDSQDMFRVEVERRGARWMTSKEAWEELTA